MAMLVDYKEFLVQDNPFSSRPELDTLDMAHTSELKSLFAKQSMEIDRIYTKIDQLILSLVTGVIDFDTYTSAKMNLLMGITPEKAEETIATAEVGADGQPQIAIRPHITAILTIVNTVNIAAVEPIALHITLLHLDSGGTISVREPAMEVMFKVRSSMGRIMQAQQQAQTRQGIAAPMAMPMAMAPNPQQRRRR